MAKRPSAREVLASAKPRTVADWIKDPANGEAREFVETWGRMREANETDWGDRRVVAYLREHYGFPFHGTGSAEAALRATR